MFARLFRRKSTPAPDTRLSIHDSEVFDKIMLATGQQELTLFVNDQTMNRMIDEANALQPLLQYRLDHTASRIVNVTGCGRVTFIRKSAVAALETQPNGLIRLH